RPKQKGFVKDYLIRQRCSPKMIQILRPFIMFVLVFLIVFGIITNLFLLKYISWPTLLSYRLLNFCSRFITFHLVACCFLGVDSCLDALHQLWFIELSSNTGKSVVLVPTRPQR